MFNRARGWWRLHQFSTGLRVSHALSSGPCLACDIRRHYHISLSRVKAELAAFEAQGWAERVTPAADDSARWTLTALGRQVIAEGVTAQPTTWAELTRLVSGAEPLYRAVETQMQHL